MATEQERADSGQQSGWHKERGDDQRTSQDHNSDDDLRATDSGNERGQQSGSTTEDRNSEDIDEQNGNSADHLAGSSGENWSDHGASYESDEDRTRIRPDSVESEANELTGHSRSSDYIDADDDKDLPTQSGTFFGDEEGGPRGN